MQGELEHTGSGLFPSFFWQSTQRNSTPSLSEPNPTQPELPLSNWWHLNAPQTKQTLHSWIRSPQKLQYSFRTVIGGNGAPKLSVAQPEKWRGTLPWLVAPAMEGKASVGSPPVRRRRHTSPRNLKVVSIRTGEVSAGATRWWWVYLGRNGRQKTFIPR